MMGLNDIDQDFFLFLPESTRMAVLDAEDIAATLEKLGYNVSHLISVFRDISSSKGLPEKPAMRNSTCQQRF